MKEVASFLRLAPIKSCLACLFRKGKMAYFVLLCFSLVSMAYGQVIQIKHDSMTLRELFSLLKEQSGYSFFIRKDIMDNAHPVRFDGRKMTVEQVLDHALRKQGIQYKIEGKEVILSKLPSQGNVVHVGTGNGAAPVQQQEILHGIVLDDQGKPVSNATITSKNSGIKTASNQQGKFMIRVELPDQLLISMIGFESKTMAVNSFSAAQIVLHSKAVQMEDVVVNGIFSRPKENFTGSAISMKGEDLKKINPTNIFKAISAVEPSFQIVANNLNGGNINHVPEIQLRGQNSFPNLSGEISQRPNQPLFILDGFEVGIERIMDLDINLIADITILKDASATSIYGSRAANGVMIVTTLAPEKGKLRLVVNNDFGINTPDLSVYNLLNAQEKLDFEQQALLYTDESPIRRIQKDKIYNLRLKAAQGGINTDWLQIPVQNGINNRTTLYLSGGDEVIRYGVQATAGFQNGVMKNQDRTNYSGQFDLSYRTSKLLFSNSIRIYQTKANESNYGSFNSYVQMNPYWSPYDNDGKIKFYLEDISFEDGYSSRITNPLFNSSLNTIDQQGMFGFQNNFQMRYNAMDGLFFETQFSIGKEMGKADQFLPAQHTSFGQVADPKLRGSYNKMNSELLNYEFNVLGNYNKRFGKSLILGTVGVNLASRTYDSYRVKAVGFGYDKLDHLLYATQYEPNAKPLGDESIVNRLGLLLNGNYSYANRYLFDVSIRRDGSSQYGTNERYGTFWSLGAGWNLHHEAFMQDLTTVNRLKLRSSYGSTGSLNIPAYSSQTRYSFLGQYIYDGELGSVLQNIGNPNLGWQEKREWNIGLDASFLNERLELRFDHYRGLTNNTIIPVSLAPSVGLSSYFENLGKIRNEGYELYGRFKAFENKEQGILWSIFANAAHNKNTLVEISNSLKISNDKLNASSEANKKQTIPNIQFQEGQSMNSIYVVKSLGIDPATGREIYLDLAGNPVANWSSTNKIAYGNTDPILRGTIGTNFLYKGFDLNILLEYRFGGQLYNETLADRVENASVLNNVDRRAYDFGWKQPGDQSIYKFISIYNTNSPTRATSRFVQDDNTLSLTSLSLGYTFVKQPFIKKMGFNSLKLMGSTNDLFRFSSIEIERGINNPFYRNYTLSLRASF